MDRGSLARLMKPSRARQAGSSMAIGQASNLASPVAIHEAETTDSIWDAAVWDVDGWSANDASVPAVRNKFGPAVWGADTWEGTHRWGGAISAVLTYRTAASTDDAWTYGTVWPGLTTTNLDATTMYIGATATVFYATGMRFPAVAIPPGAAILAAWLRFRAGNYNPGTPPISIYGNAADNAATFAATSDTSTGNPGYRTRTNAYVNWTPGAWSNNVTYNSVDISPVVQEQVDRSGWASGQALAFILCYGSGVKPAGDTMRRIVTWDYSTHVYGPLLSVQYYV